MSALFMDIYIAALSLLLLGYYNSLMHILEQYIPTSSIILYNVFSCPSCANVLLFSVHNLHLERKLSGKMISNWA